MVTKAAKKLVEHIGEDYSNAGFVFLENRRADLKVISRESYKKIVPEKGTIACIDGGNLNIINAPGFNIDFIRIFFNIFEGKKRIKPAIPNKIETFVLTKPEIVEEHLFYKILFFPIKEGYGAYLPDDILIDSDDPKLKTGEERLDISRVAGIGRAVAEWKLAVDVVGELGSDAILVRDGTLLVGNDLEKSFADELYEKSKEKNIDICSLAKTSRLYGSNGVPLASIVGKYAEDNEISAPWYCENLVDVNSDDHRAELLFVKLNENSKYVFRFEIYEGNKDNKEKIVNALSFQSNDLAFPGYPYGLVDADKNARVRYDEVPALKYLLFSQIAKKVDLKGILSSIDAHDWLNEVV